MSTVASQAETSVAAVLNVKCSPWLLPSPAWAQLSPHSCESIGRSQASGPCSIGDCYWCRAESLPAGRRAGFQSPGDTRRAVRVIDDHLASKVT